MPESEMPTEPHEALAFMKQLHTYVSNGGVPMSAWQLPFESIRDDEVWRRGALRSFHAAAFGAIGRGEENSNESPGICTLIF